MHLEPTTRCTLACPGCPRTWMSKKFKMPFPKHDLDLDTLLRFLDCPSGKLIKHFLLCGSHGDPIYYPNLLTLITSLRPASFKISTNGSHAKPRFWHQLAETVTENDTIYFSIDGTSDTNHLYRHNADWNSIMRGLDIMVKSPAKIVWKSLVFRFNQHQLTEIEQLAKNRGAIFHYETTSYFGDENLRPLGPNLVRHDLTYQHSKTAVSIEPRCGNLVNGFVSAEGYYWPCCQISSAETIYTTELWKNRQSWKINDHTLDSIQETMKDWASYVVKSGPNAPSICKMHCEKGQKGFVWSTI